MFCFNEEESGLDDVIDRVQEMTAKGVMELVANQYAVMSDDEVIEFHKTIEHFIVLCIKRRIEVQNADG